MNWHRFVNWEQRSEDQKGKALWSGSVYTVEVLRFQHIFLAIFRIRIKRIYMHIVLKVKRYL